MKSWLIAVITLVRAILYPNSKILLASGTKGQAKLIITQKIKDFQMRYPMVKREILDIKTSGNECVVYFRNGSSIEAVTSTDNARGYRGNILVCDEFRMIKEDMLKKVLKPFLNVERTPQYLFKPEYEDLPKEPNIEIYISSAWYKSHWSWAKFRSLLRDMCTTGNAFGCGLNYKLSMHHKILSQQKVESEMNADDFDPLALVNSALCQKWHMKNLVNQLLMGV